MNASLSLPPASVRRAAYAALFVSLVHIIFGAVVRIAAGRTVVASQAKGAGTAVVSTRAVPSVS